jgi:glycosyltransferase involved in cell wall biosynthesis
MRILPPKLYVSLGNMLGHLPFIYFVTPIGRAALSIQEKQEEWQTIIRDCTMMIAPSEAIKDAMVRNGLLLEKVTVLPHGIPLPKEVPPFPSTEDGIQFFYVGRICYVKGIHVMLEAFHQLTDEKAQLHLIGGSANKAERQYEQELQEKYKDDHRIIWHGKIPPKQIYDIIKDYHVSISPAIYLEVFGLNIAEAFAMGKPVIATRCGGAEMQVADSINGRLVAANDVAAMTVAMDSVINTPDALPVMSARCRATSIEEHCHRLLEFYNQHSNFR